MRAKASAVRRGLRAYVTADAANWQLGPGIAWLIALLPIVVASLVAAARLSRPLSGFLTDEGSILEWTQVAVLMVATAALAASAARAVRARRWGWAALSVAGAVGLTVVIGEELSWGQQTTNLHLFHDAIRTINLLMIFAGGGLVCLTVGLALRRRN